MAVIKVPEAGGSSPKGTNDKKTDWGFHDRIVEKESQSTHGVYNITKYPIY